MDQNITGKEMCEKIAKAGFLVKMDGTGHPTAEEIWNYSPTGELTEVFQWYVTALAVLGERYAAGYVVKVEPEGRALVAPAGLVSVSRPVVVGDLVWQDEIAA